MKRPQRVLSWVVTRSDEGMGLRTGDVLRYDARRPKGGRLLLDRPVALHEGHVDRLQSTGALRPVEGTIIDARRFMVAQLRLDRAATEAGATV